MVDSFPLFFFWIDIEGIWWYRLPSFSTSWHVELNLFVSSISFSLWIYHCLFYRITVSLLEISIIHAYYSGLNFSRIFNTRRCFSTAMAMGRLQAVQMYILEEHLIRQHHWATLRWVLMHQSDRLLLVCWAIRSMNKSKGTKKRSISKLSSSLSNR